MWEFRIPQSLVVAAGTLTGFVTVRAWLRHGERDIPDKTPAPPSMGHLTPPQSSGAGTLPVGSRDALESYVTSDGDGDELNGSEHYRVIGSLDMAAAWWSVTLYDRQGALIPNTDERHSFTSFNVIPEDDGTFVIDVAPERPAGVMNWLPSRRNARFYACIRRYRAETRAPDQPDSANPLRVLKVNDSPYNRR